ncbi:hypothetical protein N7456_005994 [Penicillium angulare]|uniref:Uncharacterized protein n=1 Tax=Penicillium angulare TaxID=116970 RepID=A0A9W9KJU7_9EURO|nr:hypothetical protein N7456_005994 [Penicillium angulare]
MKWFSVAILALASTLSLAAPLEETNENTSCDPSSYAICANQCPGSAQMGGPPNPVCFSNCMRSLGC